jgi:hypothetical protein
LTDCGGVCVSTAGDHLHCGGCGNACQGSEVCQDGKCLPWKCSGLAFDVAEYGLIGSEYLTPVELNGDGLEDLAVITESSVVPYLNAGAGAFAQQAPILLTTSDMLAAVAAGDLNGDGLEDLAVGQYHGGGITLLLARARGTFALPRTYDSLRGITSLAIADTNGDLRAEVITHASGLVVVHRNDGEGGLALPTYHEAGAANSVPAVTLALGDFDHNARRPDLAAIDSFGGYITVLRANGETFANTEYYPVDPGPAGIATGDIDGDLYDDLLFVDADSGFVRTLVNRGDGTFSEGADYETGRGGSSLAVAELDGYPGLEIAVLNNVEDLLFVFPGHGSPAPAPYTIPTRDSPWIIVAEDFDGDGIADLAFVRGGTEDAGLTVLLTRCLAPRER